MDRAKRLASWRRYNHSPKGHARDAKHGRSPKGRAKHKRYAQTAKARARWIKYNRTKGAQIVRRMWELQYRRLIKCQ
jgi:hypothetical protein